MAAIVRNGLVLFVTDFFVIVFVFSLCFTSIWAENSLYTDEDPVVQFNNETIYSHLEGTKKIWMVEFYSAWCGHCQTFAPKWVNFAWEVNNWKKFVNIGVINCAAERNFATCMEFGIQGYPTIKFYNINWKRPPKEDKENDKNNKNKDKRRVKQKSENFGITYQGGRQIVTMRRSLIDQIEKQSDPTFFPNKMQFNFASQYANETNIIIFLNSPNERTNGNEELPSITEGLLNRNDIESDLSSSPLTSYEYLILMFEKPESYIGRNLILDTTDSKEVLVRRVSSNNGELRRKYKVMDPPSLILIKLSDFKSHKIKPKNITYKDFVEELNSVVTLIDKRIPIRNLTAAISTTAQPAKTVTELNMKDLVSAISYSLRREVPKKPKINDAALEALKHWVILLWKCVPLEKPMKRFLAGLNKFLQSKEDSLASKEYLGYLESSQTKSEYLPTDIEWKSCLGSQSKFRGFPCGLWTLFHTITVTCAAKDLTTVSGTNVIIGIRDFIDYFFGCQHCRNHFLAMAKTIHNEVTNHDQAILWLWMSHNQVNARLKKDISSDPIYPKIQFPPESMCTECRKPTDDENTLETDPGYGVAKTKWNVRVVLEFLKEHYSPDNIRVKDATNAGDDLDLIDADNVRNGYKKFTYRFYPKKGSSTTLSFIGLTRLDMSLCVTLYVVVIFTLILLYLYFLRLRRKKQFKHYV